SDRTRSSLNAVENLLAVTQLAIAYHGCKVGNRLLVTVFVVKSEKARHSRGFIKQMTVHARPLWPRVPVRNGGGAANNDTRVTVDFLNDGVADLARRIVEIHSHPLRAGRIQRGLQIRLAVVDSGIVAKFIQA